MPSVSDALACVEVKLVWCYVFVPICLFYVFYEVFGLYEVVVGSGDI